MANLDKLRFANGSLRTSEIRLNMQKVHTHWKDSLLITKRIWSLYFRGFVVGRGNPPVVVTFQTVDRK